MQERKDFMEFLTQDKKENKEIIEENNEWLDKVLKKINFFKRYRLSSQKDVDFSTGVVTSVGKDVDYEENDDGKEFYYIELDSYKWINLNEIEEIIEIEQIFQKSLKIYF